MHALINALLLILGASPFPETPAQPPPIPTDAAWYLDAIQAPSNIAPDPAHEPIVVAIVDDAVRVSHRDLHPFIWRNPREIPGNRIDDDGNGHVDDVRGWDVSDGDPEVVPPPDRLTEFYHGTHLAGIVTGIVRAAYGDASSTLIRIMPVKSLADGASQTYIKDGYEGVRYAVRAGADIVLCAWGVGHISPAESAILREAHERGVLVVASAGNFPEGRDQFPAADEPVLAVAALDPESRKTRDSNYGAFVDLSAPGTKVLSAGVRSDTDYQEREGTSQSAAMVAAAAAIVKLQHPSYSPEQVIACLKQSAESIDRLNPREMTAQLGAGALSIQAAVDCALFDEQGTGQRRLRNPQGYLRYAGRPIGPAPWTIEPEGAFKGLRFRMRSVQGESGQSVIRFYSEGSAGPELVARHPLAELPESMYVAGTSARVFFEPKGADEQLEWLLEYRAEPIAFRTLYCRGTQHLDVPGVLEDGSGPADYSAGSDCKWLITAPEGKRIHFKFSELDTEPRTDMIYFFDGSGTHEDIMAIFTGPDLPPELTTWHNQVLVWFVTNGEKQGKGWRAEYRFVDP
jgi:hypothetical protein